MKKRIAIIIALSAALSGCGKKDYLTSYVRHYHDMQSFSLNDRGKNILGVDLKPDDKIYVGSYNSVGENKAAFDLACSKHNDVSYNRKIRIFPHHITQYRYLTADFIAIEVVSDKEFGPSYPAGASLNDLLTFYSVSCKPYIDSGYRELFNWREFHHEFGYFSSNTIGNTIHPVFKPVPQLTTADMTLLGNGSGDLLFYLMFEESPPDKTSHNITVTLTADDGRIFSQTAEMNFE